MVIVKAGNLVLTEKLWSRITDQALKFDSTIQALRWIKNHANDVWCDPFEMEIVQIDEPRGFLESLPRCIG